MIKLIASDIDGTLVRDGTTELNQEFFDVVLKLKEKGIHFAAASGRHWSSIENVFAPIKDKIFYISDNGASIGIEKRNLFSYGLEKNICKELILAMRENPEFVIIVAAKDAYYMDHKDQKLITWVKEGYKGNIRQVNDLLSLDEEILKISAYCSSSVYGAGEYLKERFKKRVSVKYSGDMWIDCMREDVSKGAAIKILQNALDITYKETMVFGDQHNDIEMLDSAYYSHAVANAVAEVKKAARFEADHLDSEGVLKVMKLLL